MAARGWMGSEKPRYSDNGIERPAPAPEGARLAEELVTAIGWMEWQATTMPVAEFLKMADRWPWGAS